MCRKVTVACLIFAFLLGYKATATQYAYQVTFTDKNHTPYSLSSPLAYLSSRALARRTAQSIIIDSTDLPVDPSYIDSVLTLTGGTMHEISRWFNLCVILLADSTQIHTLDGKPFIAGTKLVAFYPSFLHHKPAEATGTTAGVPTPAASTTSADAAYYSNTWSQTQILNGNYLYDLGFQGTGKLIAVLDAGFTATDIHPGFDSLRNSGRLVDTHNFTLASDYVYSYDNHGTLVLSTMAGYAPGTFVGSAPLAAYALYVTEDDFSEQPIELINMLCGAERADSIGADIITTSLGYNTFDEPAYNFNFSTDFDGKTTTTARAANMATMKGMLFVASAGNEGGDPWNMILTPGDADSALTIGSVDNTGTVWHTSGYGPNAAGQVKPDVCAIGHFANVFTDTGYDGSDDGTSFSTPQVAGWAASLWEANPNATTYQVRQAIIKCASSYSSPGNHIGYGIPNFQCTELALSVHNIPPPYSTAEWIVATPNPFTNGVTLSASPVASGDVDFVILDMTGKVVTSTRRFLFKGYNAPFAISATELPAGVYILKAVSATEQQVLKLEKL